MLPRLNYWIEKILSKDKFVFGFLLGVTLLVYGNILFGGFIFDDNIFIENNVQIQSPSNISEIYSSSTTSGSGLVGDNFYRPNQQYIYTLLYSAFGLSPSVFHLVCILFHILNGYLIFILFTKLGISRRSALFGTLIFLLHPILTEAVSYISGLSEPLVMTSILLTLIFFLKATEKDQVDKFVKWLTLGAFVFFVGLFSKENQAVALALVVLLWIFQYKRGEMADKKRPIIFTVVLGWLTLFYMVLRLKFLNFTGTVGLTAAINPYTEHLAVRLTTFVHIFPEYLKMLLWPVRLNYEKPYDAFASIHGGESWFGVFSLLGGGITALISFFKKDSKIFLGILWFLVALIPVSGIIPLNSMYLEHWLYLPIVGVIYILCIFFDKISVRDYKNLVYALLVVLVLFSGRVFARNLEWADPVKFYRNELKYTQSSARIYNNLAMAQSDALDCASAIPNYQKAIALSDSYPQTHHNLARCYQATGETEKAANEYLSALYIQPNFIYSLNSLYDLFTYLKDKRSAKFYDLIQKVQQGKNIIRADIDNAVRP
jgi:hypothetical protein